jgi:hypothetical protein
MFDFFLESETTTGVPLYLVIPDFKGEKIEFKYDIPCMIQIVIIIMRLACVTAQ